MLRITVHDSFTGLDLTSEWDTEENCRLAYAFELGTEPENVEIIMIERELQEARI